MNVHIYIRIQLLTVVVVINMSNTDMCILCVYIYIYIVIYIHICVYISLSLYIYIYICITCIHITKSPDVFAELPRWLLLSRRPLLSTSCPTHLYGFSSGLGVPFNHNKQQLNNNKHNTSKQQTKTRGDRMMSIPTA